MKLLVATATRPLNFESFCAQLRRGTEESGMKITSGIIITPGPGCNNLAFELAGYECQEQADRYADALTMALMPAKWSTTPDNLPTEDTNELEDKI